MNEIRLQYHRDTGTDINSILKICEDWEYLYLIHEYIEWLENKFGPRSIGEQAVDKRKCQKLIFKLLK